MASLSLNNLHEKAAGNGLVLGCGIDIEEYGRFERFIPIKDDIPELCRMVFSESELDNVITSYSIHYTKLYEEITRAFLYRPLFMKSPAIKSAL